MTATNQWDDGVQHWASSGLCAGHDPDEFFVTGADQHKVKSLCRECPVQNLCLADALDHRIEFGVWGGMTERERRKLLRERPRVRAWLPVLEEAALARERAAELSPAPVG